jgi:D-hydroxyproline dehydrogenase subunit alpha
MCAHVAELRCDVAVVGGGPAGIAAAVAAADAGAAVTLIDESPRPGGQIWRHVDEQRLPDRARSWLNRLRQSSVTILGSAVVFDGEVGNTHLLHVELRDDAARVRASSIILATGARELFLPFPGWTLPGVVGVGGAQALLKAGWRVHGRRVLVGGTGPLLFPVAAMLNAAGADVIDVVEQTPRAKLLRFGFSLWRTPRRIMEAALYRRAFARTPMHTGTWVVRAEGSARVERAVLTDGARGHTRTIDCDLLCVSYGLIPATELARHLGCALDDQRRVRVDATQQTTVAGVYSVGETTGVSGVDAAIIEGTIAGTSAAGATPPRSLLRRAAAGRRFVHTLEHAFAPRDELLELAHADTIVCRCEDATWAQVRVCGSMREARIVTRAGMGPCQGRICGAAIERMTGWPMDRTRAPIAPARIDAVVSGTEEP